MKALAVVLKPSMIVIAWLRGAQDDTGEASEFKTADLGKDIDAVTSIRLVHVERLLHDLHLVTETFIGNVCPASCDLDRIPVIKGP